jgi:tetratricopeptide (TPR) repeat protein
MKMRLLIFVFCIGYTVSVTGQTNNPNIYVCRLIDSVKAAFCKHDTAKTIAFLETIDKDYSDDAAIISTNKVLAELYMTKGRVNEAKEKLQYAFALKPVNYYVYGNTTICNKILSYLEPGRARADVCVAMSQLYLKENRFDSSMYYLQLADNQFFPYKNGSNYYMYKSYLSPYFADHYLAVRDTVKAAERLLDYFLKRDGDTRLLTRKLKSVLLYHHSRKEITREVKKGMQDMEFVTLNDGSLVMRTTLFGYTIREYGAAGEDIKTFKSYYKNHESWQLLRDE